MVFFPTSVVFCVLLSCSAFDLSGPPYEWEKKYSHAEVVMTETDRRILIVAVVDLS